MKKFPFNKCLFNHYSEERTSSTHALTMYRHNTVVNGKEYKVGNNALLIET